VKETQSQLKRPGVPPAKQGREVPPQWEWTQASVWTERRLETLARGSKGGKWFSLIDKVWKRENRQSALKTVGQNKGAAGVDGQKADEYPRAGPHRLEQGQDRRRKGQDTPQPVQRVWRPKLGSKELRPLGVPAVEDRVAQTAARNVIEPIRENLFAGHSYGFRPRRGAKDALRRVDHLLDTGRLWVVDADLKGYFDSIPQDKLREAVAEHRADGAVLELIQRFLKQGVMESGPGWQPTEKGTPQGAVISPLLANLPEPTGSSDGPGRTGNGALRGRLCHPVPERERSQGGVGTTAPMGGGSGVEPAPDQNADGQRPPKGRL